MVASGLYETGCSKFRGSAKRIRCEKYESVIPAREESVYLADVNFLIEQFVVAAALENVAT